MRIRKKIAFFSMLRASSIRISNFTSFTLSKISFARRSLIFEKFIYCIPQSFFLIFKEKNFYLNYHYIIYKYFKMYIIFFHTFVCLFTHLLFIKGRLGLWQQQKIVLVLYTLWGCRAAKNVQVKNIKIFLVFGLE